MSFLTYLIYLPIFIGLWVGVIGLGKARRNGAWYCMMSGMVLSTLGVIAAVVFAWVAFSRISASMGSGSGGSSSFEWMMMVGMAVVGMFGLGAVLFTVGFAMHGMQAKRVHSRIEELETVIAAQNEQLTRSGGLPPV